MPRLAVLAVPTAVRAAAAMVILTLPVLAEQVLVVRVLMAEPGSIVLITAEEEEEEEEAAAVKALVRRAAGPAVLDFLPQFQGQQLLMPAAAAALALPRVQALAVRAAAVRAAAEADQLIPAAAAAAAWWDGLAGAAAPGL